MHYRTAWFWRNRLYTRFSFGFGAGDLGTNWAPVLTFPGRLTIGAIIVKFRHFIFTTWNIDSDDGIEGQSFSVGVCILRAAACDTANEGTSSVDDCSATATDRVTRRRRERALRSGRVNRKGPMHRH